MQLSVWNSLYPSDTVSHVKTLVQDKEGIPPDEQRITFYGLQLKDDNTIAEYDVQNESTSNLIIGPGGCQNRMVQKIGVMTALQIRSRPVRKSLADGSTS